MKVTLGGGDERERNHERRDDGDLCREWARSEIVEHGLRNTARRRLCTSRGTALVFDSPDKERAVPQITPLMVVEAQESRG